MALSAGSLLNPDAQFGFVVDMEGDKTYRLLVRAFGHEFTVYAAEKPFTVEDRSFKAGSLLLRKRGNPAELPEILARLAEFKRFGKSLLVGTSRESFIGMLHEKDTPAHKRIGGSIASMVAAILNGANIVRVHDVTESVEAVKIISAIREGA